MIYILIISYYLKYMNKNSFSLNGCIFFKINLSALSDLTLNYFIFLE
jgi:hypothetical protein